MMFFFLLCSSLVPPFVIVHLALPLMSSTMKMIIYFILLDERAQRKKASSDLYSIKVAVAAAVIVKIDKTIWPKIEDWMCVCVLVRVYFWFSIDVSFAKQRKTWAWFPWDRNKPLLHYIYLTLIVLKIWRKYILLIEYSVVSAWILEIKAAIASHSVTRRIPVQHPSTFSCDRPFCRSLRFQYAPAKKDEEVPISWRISITSHIEYALTQCSIRWY